MQPSRSSRRQQGLSPLVNVNDVPTYSTSDPTLHLSDDTLPTHVSRMQIPNAPNISNSNDTNYSTIAIPNPQQTQNLPTQIQPTTLTNNMANYETMMNPQPNTQTQPVHGFAYHGRPPSIQTVNSNGSTIYQTAEPLDQRSQPSVIFDPFLGQPNPSVQDHLISPAPNPINVDNQGQFENFSSMVSVNSSIPTSQSSRNHHQSTPPIMNVVVPSTPTPSHQMNHHYQTSNHSHSPSIQNDYIQRFQRNEIPTDVNHMQFLIQKNKSMEAQILQMNQQIQQVLQQNNMLMAHVLGNHENQAQRTNIPPVPVAQIQPTTRPNQYPTDHLSQSNIQSFPRPRTDEMHHHNIHHPTGTIADPTPISQEQQNMQNMITTMVNALHKDPYATTKFPKLAGKSKNEFRLWYDQILSILASPGWSPLFDITTQSPVNEENANPSLSAKLYMSLKLCLNGDAQKIMMKKKGLNGKGITFLKTLKNAYDTSLSPVEVEEKHKEFLNLYRLKDESIDVYAARLMDLRIDLEDNGLTISDPNLKHRFIMGLGPIFTTIQQNLTTNNLPPQWQTNDFEALIRIASSWLQSIASIRKQNEAYRQLVKPKPDPQENKTQKNQPPKGGNTPSVPKPKTSNAATNQDGTPLTESQIALRAHYAQLDKDRQSRIIADIKKGTFKVSDYEPEVRQGTCVFHGTRHSSETCTLLNTLREQLPTSTPRQPRAIANQTTVTQATPEQPNQESKEMQELQNATDQLLNFTNALNSNKDNIDSYLNITCRHVQYNNPQETLRPSNKIKFVLDSGAYPHMVNNHSLFIKYSPWTKQETPAFVTFADGTTKAKIFGIGSIFIKLNGHKVIMNGVLYVPTLSDNLFSVKHHCELPGTYVHVKGQNATIAFPTFIHDTPIASEIFIHASKPTKSEKEHHITKNLNPNHEPDTEAVSRISKMNPDKPSTINKTTIEIVKLHSSAKTPTKSTQGAAGYDIYAAAPVCIPPNCRTKITTHIAMAIPEHLYGRIAPRSGMAMKNKIDIAAGVIDSDYRGEVHPCLINNSTEDFIVKQGDRIAQILFEQLGNTTLLEVPKLTTTIRNKGGFGHTDVPTETAPLSKLIPKLQINQKVTIQLPNKTAFEKGTITPVEDHFVFSNKSTTIKLNNPQILDLYTSNKLLFGHSHLITKTQPSTPSHASPPLRTVDKPLATSDPTTSYTIDQLKRNFGFRNIQSILNEMKTTINNLHISTSDKEPITDLGEVTTINKPKRNTTPLDLPERFGDMIHMDILFGSGTSVGGYRYALFLVDRATRNKFVYPMRSLKNDILDTIKTFCSDIHMVPNAIRTDFDHKIMGKEVQDFIKSNNGTIESVPPNEQNKNGLCERNWRSVLVMSRNWLASALLPCQFWWHALKRATEIANYFPIKINNQLTSPHELTYGIKPDMRSITPIFSVAYVNYKHPKTFQTQTIRTITIGRSNTTNTPEFYHPTTKQIITSNAYKLDETLTPGPAFNLPYDGGFYFNKYSQGNEHNRPPLFTPNQQVFIKTKNDKYISTKIVTIPMLDDQIYTISYPDGSLHQHEASEIFLNDPHIQHFPDNQLKTLPKWLHHLSKCTLFLNNMSRPKHGYLIKVDSVWKFRPGSKITNIPIDLPNLEANILSLIQSHQIFQNHPHFSIIFQMKNNFLLSSGIAKHVSAANLTSKDVPTLIQHKLLCQTDKQIWDDAYAEEYFGLQNLPAWTTITQKQFDSLDSKRKYALPTMAISTIKYDEHNRPKRAKYRIVALGNLDPNDWSKSDCYAPVMSLLELRLMTVLAIKKRRFLKCGDVKQAFCQAILPPNEQYILKPPPGCPLTPPNSYWMLKRTLYGLKRSPRHWYEKAVSFLNTIGLHQCKHAPCLFTGHLIQGQPPIYLGLYVDDFVYFSESSEVEHIFEKKLQELTQVDFMGQVSHFLGIRFQWRQTKTDIHVHLSQQAFTENLINQAGLDNPSVTTNLTPYRSGYPIDSIKSVKLPQEQQAQLEQELRSYVGSFLWLSQGTRPDIATITNILSKHQNKPTPAHISAAKYVIKYLKGTKDFGITFSSNSDTNISTFVHFPIKSKILTGITDANWGPQDQSKPIPGKVYPKIDIFKSRSISGHLITFHGPLHWSSKRQKVTARSSAEAEIYATDHCVRDILYLRNIMTDLKLLQETFPNKTPIYNDNMACVMWSQSKTNKRMRHMQIPENGVRENIKILDVKHIEGKINPSDIFTKEDKDIKHFQSLRNSLVQPPMQTAKQISNPSAVTSKPIFQDIDLRTSK